MKNVTRGASGGVLGARLFQERKNELGLMLFFATFCATWVILGAILGPLDFEGGAKISL